jgi:hypothetical protein
LSFAAELKSAVPKELDKPSSLNKASGIPSGAFLFRAEIPSQSSIEGPSVGTMRRGGEYPQKRGSPGGNATGYVPGEMIAEFPAKGFIPALFSKDNYGICYRFIFFLTRDGGRALIVTPL